MQIVGVPDLESEAVTAAEGWERADSLELVEPERWGGEDDAVVLVLRTLKDVLGGVGLPQPAERKAARAVFLRALRVRLVPARRERPLLRAEAEVESWRAEL